ncbi:hypothetical protein MES4922_20064 [Mesorhizobium ventifaucium]|uniref:Uncharacterized protein n=1 Tax=Mesorhizobium ventifaucium TaxID=666020 RepID=A0ABN8JK98_9HYPH|nr:hypothetical protein MES4922_20064 [Mesorhizobium ventifaucium]
MGRSRTWPRSEAWAKAGVGNRRANEVAKGIAIAKRQRSTAPPSVLPDISPTWGEIGSSLDRRLPCDVGDWRSCR